MVRLACQVILAAIMDQEARADPCPPVEPVVCTPLAHQAALDSDSAPHKQSPLSEVTAPTHNSVLADWAWLHTVQATPREPLELATVQAEQAQQECLQEQVRPLVELEHQAFGS
jgi:hypothetical protein